MRKATFILTLILFFVATIVVEAQVKKIVVGYHEDFPPYAYEVKGKVTGIFPDMVLLAAKRIGIDVEFKRFPWKRLLQLVREKKIDAIMPLLKTPVREEYLYYPDTGIALAEIYFFSRKDAKIEYSGNLFDLKDYTIGAVANYDYGDSFMQAGYLTKESCPSDEAMVMMFKNGRIDMGLSANRVVRFYAGKAGIPDDGIKFLEPPYRRQPLHMAFSQKEGNGELAKKFSNVIIELREEGKHLEILKKYNCQDDFVYFQELVIGIDRENYPPYSYWEGENLKGVCPDLIRMASKTMEVPYRFAKINWQDHTKMAESGEINAVTPVFKTKNREKSFYYPKKGLVFEKNYFFVLKTDKSTHYSGDLKSLKGTRIGVVKDYSYGKAFDDYAQYLNVKYFPLVQTMVEKLLNRKVKVIVGEKKVIEYFAEKAGASKKIKPLGPSLSREFLYLAFSKQNPGSHKIAQSFSDAVSVLINQGNYRNILKNNGIEKRVLTLAADNWQPYYGENLENNGPIAEIITEAFKRMDYGVTIDFISCSGMLEKVKTGEYDAGFAASFSNERANDYIYSNMIGTNSHYVLYKRKDKDIYYTKMADLGNYSIGVVRKYLYGKKFDTFDGLNKIEANRAEINVRHLLNDRLDLAVIDWKHAEFILKRKSDQDKDRLEFLTLLPEDQEQQELHLLVSKKIPDAEQIKADFNYGLRQISEDGTVEKIFDKHGMNYDQKTKTFERKENTQPGKAE